MSFADLSCFATQSAVGFLLQSSSVPKVESDDSKKLSKKPKRSGEIRVPVRCHHKREKTHGATLPKYGSCGEKWDSCAAKETLGWQNQTNNLWKVWQGITDPLVIKNLTLGTTVGSSSQYRQLKKVSILCHLAALVSHRAVGTHFWSSILDFLFLTRHTISAPIRVLLLRCLWLSLTLSSRTCPAGWEVVVSRWSLPRSLGTSTSPSAATTPGVWRSLQTALSSLVAPNSQWTPPWFHQCLPMVTLATDVQLKTVLPCSRLTGANSRRTPSSQELLGELVVGRMKRTPSCANWPR